MGRLSLFEHPESHIFLQRYGQVLGKATKANFKPAPLEQEVLKLLNSALIAVPHQKPLHREAPPWLDSKRNLA